MNLQARRSARPPNRACGADMLEHGGRLREASARYGIPLGDWLDLSTGINPRGFAVPALPAACWTRLPEEDDGLEAAARTYYGCHALLPVAGSQAAIQALPRLRPPCRVAVMAPGYREHAESWRRAGHRVEALRVEQLRAELPDCEVLVLIHPGNPGGERFGRDELLGWHRRMAARGGWLVLDEAFIDSTPERSLASLGGLAGLIVLRSVGKFFGLAGIRVGFVLAETALLSRLHEALGPWAIAGPAREAARLALLDKDWQQQARTRLETGSRCLRTLLTRYGLPPSGGCALFQWVRLDGARTVHEQLAGQGILTRFFERPASLRFGLPPDEAGWSRLETALKELML